jgi:hypothetical protein
MLYLEPKDKLLKRLQLKSLDRKSSPGGTDKVRKTDWYRAKRYSDGTVKAIPNKRKGCASMSRGWCPRCLVAGENVRGQVLGTFAGKRTIGHWEHYRCPECGFEWAWDRQFKGA